MVKHARASRVSVSLQRRRGQLAGSIEDNGIGLDPLPATGHMEGRTHWGLLGMQECVEALGGTFAIESCEGEGTSLLLRVPLH